MNMLSRSSAAGAVVLALLCTMTPAPIAAQSDIVVQPPTLAHWSAAISRELNATLRYPRTDPGWVTPEGTAWVDFTCSEAGKPAGMTVAQRSGSTALDRAAMAAVERIKTMHPLPVGIGHDQRYRAVIMFATSKSSLDRQRRTAMRDPRLSGARSNGILALVAPVPIVAR